MRRWHWVTVVVWAVALPAAATKHSLGGLDGIFTFLRLAVMVVASLMVASGAAATALAVVVDPIALALGIVSLGLHGVALSLGIELGPLVGFVATFFAALSLVRGLTVFRSHGEARQALALVLSGVCGVATAVATFVFLLMQR